MEKQQEKNRNILYDIPRNGIVFHCWNTENVMNYVEKTTGRVFCGVNGSSYRDFLDIEEAMETISTWKNFPSLEVEKNVFDFERLVIFNKEKRTESSFYPKWVKFTYETYGKIIEKYYPEAKDSNLNITFSEYRASKK